MNPLKASRKNLVYLRAQATTLRSSGLSVKEISKLPGKSERWMKKWSSQGEDYADKKRSWRPKVLNNAAKNFIQKARCKQGKFTGQLSQDLASKGLSGSKNSVWRFIKNKGWKSFKRQKKPLLTEKQRGARLRFAKKNKNLLPKNGMIFFPSAYQVKQSSKWTIWGGMTGRGLTELIPPGQTLTAGYYITNVLEKDVKPLLSR